MRPIRLILNAFGPYAGKEIVDFSAALDAGIFGIYGDTGSGKTTIFDGIAFALFGQSSGAERMSDDMLSDYADAKEITYVELVFDLGEKRYVVKRIPRQERAVSRGEGTTAQAHEAYLFDATGLALSEITDKNSGDMLSEKKTSLVDPIIKELLGYDAAQFRQIVLLPQGEFRKILTAKSDERSPILKRLFDVSLYENFMQKIRNQASSKHREIKDERLRKDDRLNGITQDELNEDIASREKHIGELDEHLKVMESEADKNQKALTLAETLTEKFNLLAEVERDEIELNSKSEIVKTYEKRVANARSAQGVLASEMLHSRMVGELADAQNEKLNTDKLFNEATIKFDTSSSDLKRVDGLQNIREEVFAEVQKLERWRGLVENAASLQLPLDLANNALKKAIALEAEAKPLASGARQKLEELQGIQKALPAHINSIAEATSSLTRLEREAEITGQYEASLLKRDQQKNSLKALQESHKKAAAYLVVCNTEFSSAEQELADIQALHVAGKLKTGEPCPVCGSSEHPYPAIGDPERLGRHENFEATEKLFNDAQDSERDAKGFVNTGEALLLERQQELDGLTKPERSRETLVPLLSDFKSKITTLENDKLFSDLASRLAVAEANNIAAVKMLDDASKEVTVQKEASAKALTVLNTTLLEVPEEWRKGNELTSALSLAIGKKGRLEQEQTLAIETEKKAGLNLASSKEAQRNADTQFRKIEIAGKQTEVAFEEALNTSKLNGDEYNLAKLDVEKLEKFETAIKSYGDKVAANKDRSKRLINEIGEKEKPDLGSLRQTSTICVNKLQAGRDERTRLNSELLEKNKLAASVTSLSAKIEKLEKLYEPLGEISNLVNGENDLKIRLPDFAIAAMFDEVLEAANLRLGPMTNHRYQLHRPQESIGGRSKRGLDIAVFDANTEKSRSTTSLSGGEGFQASLALALGLSDVVQQNSGGIKLDAIFIDEGFGTLDQETLDTALETLCELTSEKRAVGLISHTDQVKNLITEGFDIEVTPSGSHIHARNGV